jgi:branched-chain amino acid aminotransferase
MNDSFQQLLIILRMNVLLHELFKTMETILGKHFLRGNDLREDYEFDGGFIEHGKNLYEVVRVIDGVILFLEDHLERLYYSAKKSELRPFVEFNELKKLLKRLLKANHLLTGNIKIVFHYGNGEWEKVFIAYPVPFNYPSDEDYQKGVKTGIFRFTRPDPDIKNWLGDFRENVNREKEKNSWYEVLLENEDGIITEGSQSNIFVIKGKKIYTSPDDLILQGITRNKIISICESEGLKVEQKSFDSKFLHSADSVFLTGTSPKILPVCKIGDTEFSVNNPILPALIKNYNQVIDLYVKEHTDAL